MTSLLFEGGQFKQDDWPELRESKENDDNVFLHKAGFSCINTFGNTHCVSFEVWQGKAQAEWLIVFSVPDYFCHIRCFGWSDFIDLLSKLSPIAIAGALDNGKFGSTFLRTAGLPEDEKTD